MLKAGAATMALAGVALGHTARGAAAATGSAEDARLAVLFEGMLDQMLDILALVHIRLATRGMTRTANQFGTLFGCCRINVGYDDIGTLFGKSERNILPYAPAASCDDRSLPLQSH